MEIIFATSNNNKVNEVKRKVSQSYDILTLSDIGFTDEIEEPFDTFKANAEIKAKTVYNATGKACIAEDSGLVIQALGGRPGVLSARYAGLPVDHHRNISKVLSEMKDIDNRSAFFIAVLCYFDGNMSHFFEGVCEGKILRAPTGSEGFGYDPIFSPDGDLRSFAEMTIDEKSKYSHRGRAIEAFITYLQSI